MLTIKNCRVAADSDDATALLLLLLEEYYLENPAVFLSAHPYQQITNNK
jgi:hypothetical protein